MAAPGAIIGGLRREQLTRNLALYAWNAVAGATHYQYRLDGGPWQNNGLALRVELDFLDPGTEYTLDVRAANADGGGPVSSDTFTTLPAVAPSAPRFFQALDTAGPTKQDLSWFAPLDDGGAPITGYQVELDDERWVNVGLKLSHRVLGLVPGRQYPYRVRAVNSAGAGDPSPVVKATPREQTELPPRVGVPIPLLDDVDNQELLVRLDSVDCLLKVWWQPGDDAWYASLEAPTGTPAVTSRRVALDSPVGPSPLPGSIYCRATGSERTEPGARPWGSTHGLFYEPRNVNG